MLILALDLSPTATGVCYAPADRRPEPYIKQFRHRDDDTDTAVRECGRWIRRICQAAADESKDELLIAVERYIPSGALANMGDFMPGRDRDAQLGLHFAALTVADAYGVRFESVHAQTVRVHFIGMRSVPPDVKPSGKMQTKREAAKAAVLKRAKILGYLPPECKDDNLADACALFDYAASTFGRIAPAFTLTGGSQG